MEKLQLNLLKTMDHNFHLNLNQNFHKKIIIYKFRKVKFRKKSNKITIIFKKGINNLQMKIILTIKYCLTWMKNKILAANI